jgi:hypothetical protein
MQPVKNGCALFADAPFEGERLSLFYLIQGRKQQACLKPLDLSQSDEAVCASTGNVRREKYA